MVSLRDCNSCSFHDQGALIGGQPYPPRCQVCLESKEFLPFWSPMTKTILDRVVVERPGDKMVGPFNFPACAPKPTTAVDPALVGIGGAPTRATTLPEAAAERKRFPVASGVLDYFPDALVAISNLSYKGNEQHNPGKPLHWARGKSMDHADTMLRHFLQRGTLDTDGVRHSVKMAWRALALLQCEIEDEHGA